MVEGENVVIIDSGCGWVEEKSAEVGTSAQQIVRMRRCV